MNYLNLCLRCKHLGDDLPDADFAAPPACAAFPEGIPQEIWQDGRDHRAPIDGDNGIVFEPDGPVSVDKLDRIMARPAERAEAFPELT